MSCSNGRSSPRLWEKAKRIAIRRLGGRHSARAMQIAGKLYRDAGGTYCGSKTGAQARLSKWTKERWTTATGAKACHKVAGHVVCDRYLPARAWDSLTPAQKAATRRKKKASTKQYVANTKAAKRAGAKARKGR